jgi:hypothetical protein
MSADPAERHQDASPSDREDRILVVEELHAMGILRHDEFVAEMKYITDPQPTFEPDGERGVSRLLRLALLAALVAVVVVATAAAGTPAARCTHGVSSIGPVTLVHGHLTADSDVTPHTEECLP